MLINIRQKGIIKWILSFVELKKQLSILLYNKALREKLDISTQIYKDICGKNIVKDKNGIVRIYNKKENELIYEGEFYNNKKNGKGKEFKNNIMIFEGEFKNGKRNGKGKEYYYVDLGERIKGKQNYSTSIYKNFAKGKLYKGDRVVFEGELKNSEKSDGHYKDYNNNNDIRQGNGKEYYYEKGRLKFKGIYKNGKQWDGKGYNLYNKLVYTLSNGAGYIKEYNEKIF